MSNILAAVLESFGAFFAGGGGQGFGGQDDKPAKYWVLRVTLFALFISVLAGIWTACLSVLGKP